MRFDPTRVVIVGAGADVGPGGDPCGRPPQDMHTRSRVPISRHRIAVSTNNASHMEGASAGSPLPPLGGGFQCEVAHRDPGDHLDTQARFPRPYVWRSLHFSRIYHIILLDFLRLEQERLFATRGGDM